MNLIVTTLSKRCDVENIYEVMLSPWYCTHSEASFLNNPVIWDNVLPWNSYIGAGKLSAAAVNITTKNVVLEEC